jgi:hypothetical protein
VRGWWSQALEGWSVRPGDLFTYRHGDLHRSTHRVTEASCPTSTASSRARRDGLSTWARACASSSRRVRESPSQVGIHAA